MSVLKKFNYNTCTDEPLPGTDDWVEAARLEDSNGGYEWTEFRAYYSPSARRYFWHGDSGCSCNGWADEVHTSESFENGSRADLKRAWQAFAETHRYSFSIAAYQDGADTIRKFREPK